MFIDIDCWWCDGIVGDQGDGEVCRCVLVYEVILNCKFDVLLVGQFNVVIQDVFIQ